MYPYVTLIMPIRNEAGFIRQSLGAVLTQDYPANRMEVLVVDGLSTDRTCDIVREMMPVFDRFELRLLENRNGIVPTGMNVAIRSARGEVIVRVDGHTIIASDYVRQCVLALQRTNADNVGGRMYAIGDTPFGEAVALATSSPFGVGGGRFHYSNREEWTDSAYMGAWPRQVFEEIGLFDEELVRNQDDEFNYRLRASGGRILLCPEIRSEYTARSTPRTLIKQYFQYGYWKVRILQKHPLQMRPRQFVPPLFALSLSLSMLIPLLGWTWLLVTMLVGLYLLTNLAASWIISTRFGWQHFKFLPLIFAMLHLSYGYGFLYGLIKFIGYWGDAGSQVPVLSHEIKTRPVVPPAD
jgi:succinoglycan biosynthesis protein ExoA